MTKYVSDDNLARYTVKMKKNIADRVKEVTDKEGAANGVATLGADGKLTAAQLPALKSVNGVSVVGSGNISIDLSLYKVVDSLPTTGIDATKIYIVPAKTTGDKNIKAEYMYTGNPASAYDATKWEKLGEAQTNIVVDNELSPTSKNPVQNLVLYHEFDWFGKNIRDKAYVQINAMAPAGIQVPPGTAFAIVPNPVTSEAYADDGGWHGRELTFNGALFATKKGLDSCMKKTDMTAITNEEIDAMF